MTHVFAIAAGIGRIENTQVLIYNGLVPILLGLDTFPHRDTLRTFLWRFRPEHLNSLTAAHDRVRLELAEREGCLHIDVQDWGIGFDPAKIKPHRFGLEGHRQRARLLGGRMTIDSKPGQGTHLHVELPIVERSAGSIDKYVD